MSTPEQGSSIDLGQNLHTSKELMLVGRESVELSRESQPTPQGVNREKYYAKPPTPAPLHAASFVAVFASELTSTSSSMSASGASKSR
jgi:hypothetical protein